MLSSDQAAPFVRILELPPVKMARSGGRDLGEFDHWWTSVGARDRFSLFPRDFMWWNPTLKADEWVYALPGGVEDAGGYEVFDFPGGLYAVAACKDDGPEIERLSRQIHEWIAKSEVFVEPSSEQAVDRWEMGHVITPVNAKQTIGYHQMDLFVPIVYRNR